MSPSPADRTRVTSPRSRARRRTRAHTARTDIDEQTMLGQVYLRSLMRTQLRLSLFYFAGLVAVAGSVPLVFAIDPDLNSLTVLGLPVAWLALGAVAYPLLWGCGWLYVRAAERVEREFADMVDER